MDQRIGAQLYTVRKYCQTEADFEATLARLQRIGYRVVQISGIGDFSAERVAALCKQYGMTVACVHWDLRDFEERPEHVIAYQKALDCPIAGMSYIPAEYRRDLSDIRALVEKMNSFYDLMQKNGLEFVHHNHAYEFARYDGVKAMDYMLKNGKFGFIADVYWIAFAGIDPASFIKHLGDKCRILHYKDLCVTNQNQSKYAPAGDGNLDWDAIIEASDKAEFALVEQDECDTHPIDCLEASYRFLSGKGFV